MDAWSPRYCGMIYYTKTLKSLGLIVNVYIICIANSVIDDKECTIAWYVDDNKVSDVEET